MTSLETIEGVMVYPGVIHPIYQEVLGEVINENGEDLTSEEAFQIAMYRIGELAARAEKPKELLA